MITQHRDHYGDYTDLLRCHDALLEAAETVEKGLMDFSINHSASKLRTELAQTLRTAIAQAKGGIGA